MNRNPPTAEPPNPRTALITGASSGIGEAFADVFAANGYGLVLVARRLDRLEAVAGRVRSSFGVPVTVMPWDLSVPNAPTALTAELTARGIRVDALVNNAGYGIPGAYAKTEWQRHAAFMNVMVVAVAELTRLLLPAMIGRRFGRIVNVASLAGLVPAPPGHTLYAASKSFLIKFSEALAHEVAHHGVHVTAVCPGFTYSEFHDVTGTRATVNKLPKFMWMDSPRVAREGFAAVERGIPVYVTGRVNKTIAFLARTLPQTFVALVNRRAAASYRHT